MGAKGPTIKRECFHPRVKHEHGTSRAYMQDGCRCDDCRAANARHTAQIKKNAYLYGKQMMDAAGTQRRIQALMANGWSCAEISRTGGWNRTRVWNIIAKIDKVSPATHRQIAAIYDELWDREPPMSTPVQRNSASRVRNHARAKGYAPPLAWDDDTIDDPSAKPAPKSTRGPKSIDDVAVAEACLGRRRGKLTLAERQRVVEILTARGVSAEQISERLGQTSRTVVRRRAA